MNSGQNQASTTPVSAKSATTVGAAFGAGFRFHPTGAEKSFVFRIAGTARGGESHESQKQDGEILHYRSLHDPPPQRKTLSRLDLAHERGVQTSDALKAGDVVDVMVRDIKEVTPSRRGEPSQKVTWSSFTTKHTINWEQES